ncbi:single-stranded-DNA-specific exonuclease RecJ [Patescibacteria group bacterium]|nr:single-stranded-DNA-specific exonuclease RecJ [Patescibacteria group bacterium]
MKRWNILNKSKFKNAQDINEKIIKILLENRGLTDKKAIQDFLNPKLEHVTIDSAGIDKGQLKKAMNRIYDAIKNHEQIIIYGDYDVDGITGTAILWETLYGMKAKVLPYLPDRIEEGYGLSEKGISRLRQGYSGQSNLKLIITVDNGIVANEAVDFANENNIDVIITDHHTIDTKLPDAFAVVHTTKLCGAGIAWLISKEFKKVFEKSKLAVIARSATIVGDEAISFKNRIAALSSVARNDKNEGEYDYDQDPHLELAALGTIADMVPLTGDNRTIVKFGLEKICRTRRPGLIELCKQAGIEKETLGIYEIGFIIAPRLNASGRIENPMDSLRLLCTKDKTKACVLAEKLEITNRERQFLMKQAAEHAIMSVKMEDSLKKILIVSHESYQQGVIGLVAGKLVEEYYRPSIVISKGEKYSKASARSVKGFNMIEFLRSKSEYFVNVGGHPMAAGFTIETEKIIVFKQTLETTAEELIDGQTLTKSLRIDCELPFSAITKELYMSLQQLEPFGMENPQPVFTTKGVTVNDLRILGREEKHIKLQIQSPTSEILHLKSEPLEAIAFGMGEMAREIKTGSKIDLVYTIDENTWNGNTKLQLKVKDIKKTLANQG